MASSDNGEAAEAAPSGRGPGGQRNGGRCPHKDKGLENRRILRLATDNDMARQAENEVREQDAFEYCQSRVAIQRLEMKLVAVEVVFDGSKTIFYYTADERVDFRLLVKELVSRFRTRIEMRQIGVRHEARMIGGLGACGRGFCCAGFLSNFAPVSVKMAKEQNISLSPSKISGVCGRLMCCLAFEHTGPIGRGHHHHAKGGGRGAPPPDDMPVAEMNEEEIARLAAQFDD
ncbi:hypothetical protein C4J81_11055 [Deltaproteobacteria bacterium Smac51]|nr:hypothetical protein C4J81_11055 [Deltaproteobacteria bacterium Smac51]